MEPEACPASPRAIRPPGLSNSSNGQHGSPFGQQAARLKLPLQEDRNRSPRNGARDTCCGQRNPDDEYTSECVGVEVKAGDSIGIARRSPRRAGPAPAAPGPAADLFGNCRANQELDFRSEFASLACVDGWGHGYFSWNKLRPAAHCREPCGQAGVCCTDLFHAATIDEVTIKGTLSRKIRNKYRPKLQKSGGGVLLIAS